MRYEGERQNIKLVSNKEIMEIELSLLRYLDDICRDEKIQLYLTYGTLLGAARHKGFIPWDDDIDVMIKREDFFRLCEAIKSRGNSIYKLIDRSIDTNYSLPLAKLYDDRTILIEDYGSICPVKFGVYIDIFILDNLPNQTEKEALLFKKARKIRHEYGLSTRKFELDSNRVIYSVLRNIAIIPFHILGYRHFLRKYEIVCVKYINDNTTNMGIVQFGEGYGDKERIPKLCLTGKTKLLFEGDEYCVPDNYVDYLTQLYGDYMCLPPENERVTKHNFTAYWK